VFTVRVVVLPGVIEVLANEQLPTIAAGTEQVKLTEPVKPLTGLTPIVVVPDAPGAEMANEVGLGTTLKSGVPLVTLIVVAEGVDEAE
jgi:hypothetical protein